MIGIIQQQNRIGKPFLLEGWLTVSSLVGKGERFATLIEAKQTMIVRYCENRRGKKISKHHRMLSWLASCYPNRQELPSPIIEKESHCYKITFCSFDSKIGTIKISHFGA